MRKIVLWLILLVVIAGCSNGYKSSKEYKPSNEDIVETHGKLENLQRLDQFMENVVKTDKDRVRIVRHTVEGDPILYDLAYNGKHVELTYDTTRDEYREGDISITTCDSFEKSETASSVTYFLSGCRQTGEFGEDVSVLEIEK